MGKSQLGVRVPDELIKRLNEYVAQNNTSKTDVVIGALAQYLDSPESVPLGERVTAVEDRLSEVETLLAKIGSEG